MPVVLSDFWELPFEDFLPLPQFVIKWPMHEVTDKLLRFLEEQSDEVVEALMAAGRLFRCWYVYPPLLHEQETARDVDELARLCPQLDRQNAFKGIVRSLESKRRASRSTFRFFDPSRASAGSLEAAGA